MGATLYTIGHSTRELAEFLELLRAHAIERIVDVRRYPGSRRHPHFGSESLALSLADAGIAYRHAPELGGRRSSPAGASPNRFWRNDAFRAYADYMMTEPFRAALALLLDEASRERTAVMCAEAVPWRCHRNLISDAAVAAGADVRHVIDASPPSPHALNQGARIAADGSLRYPGVEDEQGSLDLKP